MWSRVGGVFGTGKQCNILVQAGQTHFDQTGLTAYPRVFVHSVSWLCNDSLHIWGKILSFSASVVSSHGVAIEFPGTTTMKT